MTATILTARNGLPIIDATGGVKPYYRYAILRETAIVRRASDNALDGCPYRSYVAVRLGDKGPERRAAMYRDRTLETIAYVVIAAADVWALYGGRREDFESSAHSQKDCIHALAAALRAAHRSQWDMGEMVPDLITYDALKAEHDRDCGWKFARWIPVERDVYAR